MPARVLFIGLDSAEPMLIERWVGEGRLPAIACLSERGAAYQLDNCWSTLPTAVWPELTTGRSPGKVALFFAPRQLHTGEIEPRAVEADEVDPSGFWTIASEAGRRVAAIDLPWTVPPTALNGLFLAEWGTHDRWFGTRAFPETLIEDIRQRHGDYPVGLCDDDYGDSVAERERLAADLLNSIEYETRLLLDLIEQEDWDLFACVFGQFQCVGHNFWAFLDAGARVPSSLRTAIFDVASKVDETIATLRAAAGEEAIAIVVASHGMGPMLGGPQLLPEVLVRLGAGSGKGSAAQVRSRLPIPLRRTIRRLTPPQLRRRLQEAAGSLPAPLASAETRAIALPGDVNGYIRLNLAGREPNGRVAPGVEAEAELEKIRVALLELVDPSSGERIVTDVVSADEAFGADRHADIPDLMVRFRSDLGRLDSCVSERLGRVTVPHRIAKRSGDHTGEARLWVVGNGVQPTRGQEHAHALDVAPTVLSLLEVPIPADLDGRPLDVRGEG